MGIGEYGERHCKVIWVFQGPCALLVKFSLIFRFPRTMLCAVIKFSFIMEGFVIIHIEAVLYSLFKRISVLIQKNIIINVLFNVSQIFNLNLFIFTHQKFNPKGRSVDYHTSEIIILNRVINPALTTPMWLAFVKPLATSSNLTRGIYLICPYIHTIHILSSRSNDKSVHASHENSIKHIIPDLQRAVFQ